MRRNLILFLTLTLSLAGCGNFAQSNYNPLNWFKSGKPTAQSTGPAVLYVPPVDNRVLVAQVLSLKLERNPNGAIVRATGLPPSQGWWKAQLVKLDQPDATKIVYAFRVFPPVTPQPVGTTISREITVAANLSNLQLAGVRTIAVQGATNTLSVRR